MALVGALLLPELDKVRNEVDAWLISNHIARNQPAGHAEAAQTEQGRALLVGVVAHEILAQVFHVVHVQAHVMAEAVGHEQAGNAEFHHIVHRAFHEAQVAQAFQHQAGGCQMYVAVGHPGLGQAVSQGVAVVDYLIDIPLPGSEFATRRIGAGKVAGIVGVVLRSSVDHHKFAGSYEGVVPVVVEHLAVLGEDGSEAHAPAFRQGDSFHLSHNLLLLAAYAYALAGHGVHLLAQDAGVVEFGNLFRLLDEAHLDYGLDERLRGLVDPKALYLHVVVPARRRDGVHRAPLHQGGGYYKVQLPVGRAMLHTYPGGLLGHAGLRPHPDDVVDRHVVGVDGLLAAFKVDGGGETGLVDTEIIEPCAVLAELIAIVFVLGGSLHIADEDRDAFFAVKELHELFAAADIDIFLEHIHKDSQINANLSDTKNSLNLKSQTTRL